MAYDQFGKDTEMIVQDSSSFAGEGERVSFLQVQVSRPSHVFTGKTVPSSVHYLCCTLKTCKAAPNAVPSLPCAPPSCKRCGIAEMHGRSRSCVCLM